MRSLALLLTAVCALTAAVAAGRGEPGPYMTMRVELAEGRGDLQLLRDLDIDIEAVFDGWARLCLVREEIDKLEHLGFELTPLPDEGKIGRARMEIEGVAANVGSRVPTTYHTYETLTSDLATIASDHSDITRLVSIGLTVQGREMWMMEITDNPDVEEDEPEIHYISSIHGDEVVGKELCFNLINYLTDNYGTDPRVTNLVNSTEIRIMPSMNPDGTALGQRYNANGYDLNRSFPDQFVDPDNTTDGRQPEVANVMNWVLDRRPIVSLNYHGGTLVANYPFDNNPQNQSVESPTPDPDDAALIYLAESYTVHNTPMWTSTSFYHGITNGAAWYAIHGGMQDWFYVWSGGWDMTLEVSETKWPAGSTLPGFWDDNLESMLSYFEGSLEGVRGIVTDAETGLPLDARVYIDDNPWPSHTDPDAGDYHRLVLPGAYTLEATAVGYGTQTIPIEVYGGAAEVYDFDLIPLPTTLEYESSVIDDGAGGNGYIDPGESADLAVAVRNVGRSATAISAELVPTGWYATVTRGEAGFPDLAVGDSGESLPPHYAIDIDSSAPDGHKVGFALRWRSADDSGTTDPFFLDVGGPACHSEPSDDTPQAINDYSTTYSQVIYPDPVTIAEVRVPVDISHTYIGDLEIQLLSPSGTHVMLHNRSGGSANDIVGTYGEDLTPAESLDAFIGESATGGAWQMDVYDAAGGDTGVLNSWSLTICGQQPEEATPEMRFDDLEVEPDGVTLRWWPYPGLTSYKVYRATDPSAVETFADVTSEDGDDADTQFKDTSVGDLIFYIVTGVGPQGEGPKGHFGE